MIGIDTNVLVRFLIRDDQAQFERARKLIEREASVDRPVFISLLVLLETEWVLRSRYKLAKTDILDTFAGLLGAIELSFEDETSIEEALYVWRESSAKFADCLIGARHRACGCRATSSFDVDALKLPGFIAVYKGLPPRRQSQASILDAARPEPLDCNSLIETG
jgi:predicted nucleic-acid-binding protein